MKEFDSKYCNRCRFCTHYNQFYEQCMIRSNSTDCDDYETNDHFSEDDDYCGLSDD